MPNYNDVYLSCKNPVVTKACFDAIHDGTKPYTEEGTRFKDGDTEFHAVTLWGIPNGKIEAVSKNFPNDLIRCKYILDEECWSIVHLAEYQGGKERFVNAEQNYHFSELPFYERDARTVRVMVTKFFCRMDVVRRGEDGWFQVDWLPVSVCVGFEYQTEDGKMYRIEATKDGPKVDFEVFTLDENGEPEGGWGKWLENKKLKLAKYGFNEEKAE